MTEKSKSTNHRRKWLILISLFAAIVLATVFAILVPHQEAKAHGAMTAPASRTYACYLENPENPDTPACQAAVAAGGTQPLYDWFAVLRSDGAGRTRGFIPDGQLCSAGTTKYAPYDAARADWPSTNLQSGVDYTFIYAAWAAHPGTFYYYVTKDGYNPTQPLKWDDLESQPFLTAVQPPVIDGSYRMPGKTPANKQGRHIIYSVWTRSDSLETFYGCADVVFGNNGTVTPTPPTTPPSTPPVTPTRTSTPVPTSTPSTSVSCTATVAVSNSWPGGFQAAVTVKNTGSSALTPWMIHWNMPTGVTLVSGWNATVTQDGSMVMADAPSWNRTLAAGASVSIGFVANGPSSPLPSGVTLNGKSCGV
jgi:predicted carbohydrate-binding protein with CBM5 and CBM33 domain